jgi:hypothetical protein
MNITGTASYKSDKMVRLFDGKKETIKNWIHNKNWHIEDGAISWKSGAGKDAVWSAGDYGSFRLFIDMRIIEIISLTSSHLAVLLWGPRKETGDFSSRGFISVIPPIGWMWDYKTDASLTPRFQNPENNRFAEWNEVEILACLETGTIQMGVNGVYVMRWESGGRKDLEPGPIGLQMHWDGKPQYKNIWIETNPEDRENLVSVE